MFNYLKEILESTSVIMVLNWIKPFEVMYNMNGMALDAGLGQKKDKLIHPIYNSSKSLNDVQYNYTVYSKS